MGCEIRNDLFVIKLENSEIFRSVSISFEKIYRKVRAQISELVVGGQNKNFIFTFFSMLRPFICMEYGVYRIVLEFFFIYFFSLLIRSFFSWLFWFSYRFPKVLWLVPLLHFFTILFCLAALG